MNKQGPKILFYDIETSPNLSYTWGIWEQNVIAVEREWYMLSFAYKWNDGKTQVCALPDFKLYKKDPTNDLELVRKLWELLSEADIVVAHNGDAFDNKKANSRFLFHGLPPPEPYKTVDTLKVARKYFKLNSNKLNDLGKLLNLGQKVQTGGFETWLGCMNGDPASWKIMCRYNKQDVELLYKVYQKIQGWMTNHPNVNLYSEQADSCPVCGGKHIQKRGYGFTKLGKYQRRQCTDCGAWGRERELIKLGVNITQ